MLSNPRNAILIGVTVDRSINFHSALAVALRDAGYRVKMVSSSGPNLEEISKDVETHVLQMERNPHPVKDLISFIDWLSFLRKSRPSSVMIGTPKASLLGLLAARITRVPVRIYFVHGLRLETTTGAWRAILWCLERLSISSATDVIAVSHSVRDRLVELNLLSPEKVKVIGQGSAKGIDIGRFSVNVGPETKGERRRIKKLDPDLFTLGFVGRLTEEKGIAELRDALALLKSRGMRFQVLLVGEAEDQLGKTVVQELRNQGISVIAPGRVQNPEEYLQMMDLFCLPTYREGLVTVVLEAFASRVPVVSTEVTGVVDLVENGYTGLLVPPRDHEALANAITILYEDLNLRDSLADNAFKFVQENFDTEQVVTNQRDFILKLISKVK